jgi:hypothetical protein
MLAGRPQQATQKYPVYASSWVLLCRVFARLGQHEHARGLQTKGLGYLLSLGDRAAIIARFARVFDHPFLQPVFYRQLMSSFVEP